MRRCLCCTAVIVVASSLVQADVAPVDRTASLGGLAIESMVTAESVPTAIDIDAMPTATLASSMPFVLTLQPTLALCIGLFVSARRPRRCVT